MQQQPASYFIFDLPESVELNKAIQQQFYDTADAEETVRSHFFAGRYENIYLTLEQVPAMQTVIEQATQFANDILRGNETLQVGFWFNAMAPGDITQLHRHDEYDECLSGVYYIEVPEDSGELVLHEASGEIRVTPVPGRFVFFAPDVPHEVTENKSTSSRLSVGMNFGVKQSWKG